MTELTASEEPHRSFNPVWAVLLIAGLALLATAGWLVLSARSDDEPDIPESLQIGWAIADVDSAKGTLTFEVDPASKGVNTVRIDVDAEQETWLADLRSVDVRFLPLRGGTEEHTVTFELSEDELSASQDIDFGGSDRWEALIRAGDRVLATIFLMLPDPNLFGEDGQDDSETDPAAQELYQRASANVASWHRVRYSQQLSNGAGQAVVSFRIVNDGSDGSEAGFWYSTPGGLEAYVLGTTAWSKYPDEDWEVRSTNAMIPPSEWGGEYLGATGFQLGPMSESPDGPCRLLTFVVPGSDRQAVAWYAWCIDEESGQVRRDSMISRAHYMITEFSDIDGDLVVKLPPDAPPPPNGTPVAALAEVAFVPTRKA